MAACELSLITSSSPSETDKPDKERNGQTSAKNPEKSKSQSPVKEKLLAKENREVIEAPVVIQKVSPIQDKRYD